MSATRDKNQKIAFVYSNLYQLYKKGHTAAVQADVSSKDAAQQAEVSPKAEAPAVSPEEVAQALSRAELARGLTTGIVLKSDVVKSEVAAPRPVVSPYRPAELIAKRIPAPLGSKPAANNYEPILHKRAEQMGLTARTVATPIRLTRVTNETHATTVTSLKKNLAELNDLHDRLRFMLQELEDLVKN